MKYTSKIIVTAVMFSCCSTTVWSQDSTALHYAGFITPQTISRHLHVLASDSLEGRETAKPGMQKAASYVAKQFSSFGMKPLNEESYYQQVPLVLHTAGVIDIIAGNKLFEPGTDFYSFEMPSEINLVQDKIVFAGYGIVDSASGWNDYKDVDVTGKIVLIAEGEPVDKEGLSLISKTMDGSSWKKDSKKKIEIAKMKNAAAIFFVLNEFDGTIPRVKRWVANGRLNLFDKKSDVKIPVIYINRAAGDQMLTGSSTNLKKLKSRSVKTSKSVTMLVNTAVQISCTAMKTSCTNVLGYVEGSDLKDELIVISAHLDHLGKRDNKIYYGADDDGSGCATILNMAEAFMKAKSEGKGPRRSILFITFTGEEKGLLGSSYYTSNPYFPLQKTVANLNIDMIGRVDTISHGTNRYTYVIGSKMLSTDLHKINETANSFCCNVMLDYKYDDPSDTEKLYYRSDHYNFAKNKVPVIFYFTGLHEDYHEPTDTPDKIDFVKTSEIGKLIFNTAWELSNRTERIKMDVETDPN